MPKVFVHPRQKEVKPRVKNWSTKWKKISNVLRGFISWRLLRGIIFIVCLSLFFYQSVKFLQVYYKYPTTTKIELTSPKEFEFPAVTVCNMNNIKRTKFCAEYPNLCERPSNITEACEIEPSACKDNPSNLVIPKLGILANKSYVEVVNTINEIYYSGNTTKEFWEEWGYAIKTKSNMKPVFLKYYGTYLPCFAENLLLNCTDEPKKINLVRRRDLGRYDINLRSTEQIYFGSEPRVFFFIHSPFVPQDALKDGRVLELGHKYNIYVKLEEENLLPFPYETDCVIYEDTWNKGSPHRPRSQEMCKELCVHSLFEKNKNMIKLYEFKIIEYPLKLCFGQECEISFEDKEFLEQCRRDCKPSCRNLKHSSTITETILDKPKREKILDPDYERDNIQVRIYLEGLQVVVNKHVAVYDTGDLFSYIGGLMGCWLGISIWAFAGIAENVFRTALRWMERIKLYLKNASRTQHAVFAIHQNNVLKI